MLAMVFSSKMGRILFLNLLMAGFLFFSIKGIAQDESGYRPGLAFREDWKEIPAETPVNQHHVNHPDLILTTYGPGRDSIKKSHHDAPSDDPYYIWSGLCQGNWAVTVKHRDCYVDLSGFARIRWRTKQFGFRELHLLLKLRSGAWLVSAESDPVSGDWREREFIVQDLHWYSIDMETVTEQGRVTGPDLSEVDEIGFTDLMSGGGSAACSRLDWLEVYGYLVPRKEH